jgi:hypothetical protein
MNDLFPWNDGYPEKEDEDKIFPDDDNFYSEREDGTIEVHNVYGVKIDEYTI